MFSDVSLILMAAIVRALTRKSSHRKSDPPPVRLRQGDLDE